ncbi:hypothetical protein L7F22_005432 [Adiantum nelumboides]|nr:hypothetical protein [Adiantum nelumboides]
MDASFLGGARLLYNRNSSTLNINKPEGPRRRYARRAVIVVCRLPATGDEAAGLSEANIPASRCACCGRRSTLGALSGALPTLFDLKRFAHASSGSQDPKLLVESVRGTRPGWYEELYAVVMQKGMKSYEMQMEDRKLQLFSSLDNKALDVLELGVGTGPNLKYYPKGPELRVIGVDPNQHMEKYARAAASAAGLRDSQFSFVHAVGEALPLGTASVDAVVCTLVLCSVKDVAVTLKEVKKVLRPGGLFLFIEHVAAPAGSSLKFWQDFLNPVQQSLIGPQIIGMAMV